jgi:SAM-dependent methyltransferase/4-amino-4-deoxy-L-arabinose transferase-like glycosyltransferase
MNQASLPMTPIQSEILNQDDLLWQHLKSVPAFRALLRAVEARFYHYLRQTGEIQEPVLDLGCGDGHFAGLAFTQPLTAGIDPWWGPLNKAQRAGAHQLVSQAMGDKMPFPDGHFATVISNSVLEHIPDIQPVLQEANRVLRPGGKLIITMPSHHFTEYLGGAAALQGVGLGDAYRRFFNQISRHERTDSAEQWAERLAQAGFVVDRWQYYFSKAALRALEWGHVQGLPSAVLHFLTGHWIIAPWNSNLRRTEQWLRPFYEEEAQPAGAYVLFVAHKQADHPIPTHLPAARPMEVRNWQLEIQNGSSTATGTQEAALPLPAPLTIDNSQLTILPPPSALPTPQSPIPNLQSPISPLQSTAASPAGCTLISLGLASFSIIFTMLGQASLGGGTATPGGAIRWFGLGLLALLGLGWASNRRRPLPALRLPNLAALPTRRYLYLLAFMLTVLAQRQVSNPATQRPTLAIFLWAIAIAAAAYAFWDESPNPHSPISNLQSPLFNLPRWEILTLAILFIAALVVRLVNLTGHPFILNGIEANIGLEAWAAATGQLGNPFATGWLTNPTLPLYFLAIPLKFLGRTALAIRLLSPLVGALTVPALYLVGRRLYSPAVGLVAAILLAGAHVHLHYSRLGMTNIWDPLLLLTALGLLYAAWQSGRRTTWVLAGLAAGFNAYFFTASHLLPIILLALFLFLLLTDRRALWQQRTNILIAAAVALVALWPQYSFYNNNPGIYLGRANELGILQNGWLAREAAATGENIVAIFGRQWWQSALAFNAGVDTSPSYNSGMPMLLSLPALLFSLGVLLALIRLRQFRYTLLLVWLLVTVLFAGALLENPPASHRLLIAMPAATLLAGLALAYLGQQVWREAGFDQRYLLPALAFLAVLLVAGDLLFYFGRYRNENRFSDRNTEVAYQMSNYLNDLDGDWTAFFYGPPAMFISFPTIPFLTEGYTPNINLFDVNEPTSPIPAAPTKSAVFIFLPERAGEAAAIQTQYPGGIFRTFEGVYSNPLFLAYEVPSYAPVPAGSQ